MIAGTSAGGLNGAFLALGLSGTFLTTRTRDWRPITACAIATSGVALLAVAVGFGSPGPEPFSLWVMLEALGLLVLPAFLLLGALPVGLAVLSSTALPR